MKRPRGPLVGIATFLALIGSLLFWAAVFVPGIVLKVLIPVQGWRRLATRYMVGVATLWVATNHALLLLLHGARRAPQVDARIDPQRSYLVICNHQSWADILILLDVLHRRVQFPRFFLKRELLWLPLVGLICWSLDMPFMRRRAVRSEGSGQLRDADTTRAFCERFRGQPVSVVNFVEGTRRTPARAASTPSPFRALLRPKAAGIAYTLGAMGEQFHGIVDLTFVYPERCGRSPLLWAFLCGQLHAMHCEAQLLEVPQDAIGAAYERDPEFRQRFQAWLNDLWRRKDQRILDHQAADMAADYNLAGFSR